MAGDFLGLSRQERIEAYRKRAVEALKVADVSRSKVMREQFLSFAYQWEQLATRTEAMRPLENLSIMAEKSPQKSPTTLGDVLYAKSNAHVPEQDWAALIRSIALGDQLALHALYEMAHRIVFTLILRITSNQEAAEDLTIDVFHDVWRGASHYDAANGTALGWIMNLGRSRAIDPRRFESRNAASRLTEVRRPTAPPQLRLALRIAEETGIQLVPPPARLWSEPEWEQVAPGIECKLLATDTERYRVSMMVRLAPGASYPAHRHAGEEELHLLDGELWIDGRKLYPGDYNHGAPGTRDERVWSETGCACLLVTSTKDTLY